MVRMGVRSWSNLFCIVELRAKVWHVCASRWAPEPQGGQSNMILGPSQCCIKGRCLSLGVLASMYPVFGGCEV